MTPYLRMRSAWCKRNATIADAPHRHRCVAANTALLAQGGVYIGIACGARLADYGIQEHRPPVQAVHEAGAARGVWHTTGVKR